MFYTQMWVSGQGLLLSKVARSTDGAGVARKGRREMTKASKSKQPKRKSAKKESRDRRVEEALDEGLLETIPGI
jgi:hypothetical protein